jgi:hypothetical protein
MSDDLLRIDCSSGGCHAGDREEEKEEAQTVQELDGEHI